MNQQETDKILDKISRRGMKPGLERMEKLMQALGNPQKKFSAVHVTGSNGKGSVCAMLESILTSAGFRVGLYTSPHLVDVRERIRFNKKNISSSDFYKWVSHVWNCAKKAGLDEDLTYFELLTAVAFFYFAETKTELAVIEVGLGGRLDATNVIPSPEVCVITNIALEHTEILGKSVEKIAWEKAGIVKKNSACVTGAAGSALEVIREICFQKDACLLPAGLYRSHPSEVLSEDRWNLETLLEHSRLKGEFQKQNILITLKVLEILQEKGWKINEEQILSGLEETFLQGRFQKMQFKLKERESLFPVLLDGAHNPAAIKALVSAIHLTPTKDKRCLLIFNALKDKDIRKMVQILLHDLKIFHLLIPALNTERSTPPVQTEKIFRELKKKCSVKTFRSVQECWESLYHWQELAVEADWILATGSLYLIGETLKTGFLKSDIHPLSVPICSS